MTGCKVSSCGNCVSDGQSCVGSRSDAAGPSDGETGATVNSCRSANSKGRIGGRVAGPRNVNAGDCRSSSRTMTPRRTCSVLVGPFERDEQTVCNNGKDDGLLLTRSGANGTTGVLARSSSAGVNRCGVDVTTDNPAGVLSSIRLT